MFHTYTSFFFYFIIFEGVLQVYYSTTLYNVAVLGAAEAAEVVIVQLHRRSSVLVENVRGHTIAYAHTVIFCGRGNSDGFFDFPEDVPV